MTNCGLTQKYTIRNWKVAAPLKAGIDIDELPIVSNPQLKSCDSIEGSMGRMFLRSHSTILNWKVATPLKEEWFKCMLWTLIFNPQLKSCGSIEGIIHSVEHVLKTKQSATEKLRLHWSNRILLAFITDYYNPQLKSCGSIEGIIHSVEHVLKTKQSATEKLRLHWSNRILLAFITDYYNPQLKSCGSIEAKQKRQHSRHHHHSNPQLKSCGSIEAIAL